MADTIIETLIGSFLSTTGIGDAVQGRVFQGPISAMPQPEYPCVTIQRASPGPIDRSVPVGTTPLLVSVFSVISFDECNQIYEVIHTLLHQQATSTANGAWVAYQRATPFQDSESIERIVYILHIVFDLEFIGL